MCLLRPGGCCCGLGLGFYSSLSLTPQPRRIGSSARDSSGSLLSQTRHHLQILCRAGPKLSHLRLQHAHLCLKRYPGLLQSTKGKKWGGGGG